MIESVLNVASSAPKAPSSGEGPSLEGAVLRGGGEAAPKMKKTVVRPPRDQPEFTLLSHRKCSNSLFIKVNSSQNPTFDSSY